MESAAQSSSALEDTKRTTGKFSEEENEYLRWTRAKNKLDKGLLSFTNADLIRIFVDSVQHNWKDTDAILRTFVELPRTPQGAAEHSRESRELRRIYMLCENVHALARQYNLPTSTTKTHNKCRLIEVLIFFFPCDLSRFHSLRTKVT